MCTAGAAGDAAANLSWLLRHLQSGEVGKLRGGQGPEEETTPEASLASLGRGCLVPGNLVKTWDATGTFQYGPKVAPPSTSLSASEWASPLPVCLSLFL